MVWWYASTRHLLAISPWVRMLLRSSFIDKCIHTLIWGMLWWIPLGFVSLATRNADLFFIVGWAPWGLLLLEIAIDRNHTNSDIQNLMAGDDVVLATRAEYIGGHPQLPHGRFAYLSICGSQENPLLRVTFPGLRREEVTRPSASQDGSTPGTIKMVVTTREDNFFDIPLLDISKTMPKYETVESLAGTLLASLSEKPGKMFSEERVTLNVDYQGAGGRKHRVEFTSFFRGNDEIRNWRNYLVCAQAEADTGVKPFEPWKSLKKTTPPEEPNDDSSGNGSKVQPARRAFKRR